jgi:hypothetical protein
MRLIDDRFGSKADICGATSHVRFTPNSDRESGLPQPVMSALLLRADMCVAKRHVCFTPNSDRQSGYTRCKKQMCATKQADGGARLAHAGLLWSVASLVGWPNKVLVVVLDQSRTGNAQPTRPGRRLLHQLLVGVAGE